MLKLAQKINKYFKVHGLTYRYLSSLLPLSVSFNYSEGLQDLRSLRNVLYLIQKNNGEQPYEIDYFPGFAIGPDEAFREEHVHFLINAFDTRNKRMAKKGRYYCSSIKSGNVTDTIFATLAPVLYQRALELHFPEEKLSIIKKRFPRDDTRFAGEIIHTSPLFMRGMREVTTKSSELRALILTAILELAGMDPYTTVEILLATNLLDTVSLVVLMIVLGLAKHDALYACKDGAAEILSSANMLNEATVEVQQAFLSLALHNPRKANKILTTSDTESLAAKITAALTPYSQEAEPTSNIFNIGIGSAILALQQAQDKFSTKKTLPLSTTWFQIVNPDKENFLAGPHVS